MKLRTCVFSAILVILIISFGDDAESKSLEIDRRLERAAEARRNGTSLARADSDRMYANKRHPLGGIYANTRHPLGGRYANIRHPFGGIYANIPPLRQSTPSTDDPGPAVVAVPFIQYGCYWSKCWRSCKKGAQNPSGYFKKKNVWHEFCQNDKWCYSDLGVCSHDAGCYEAPKWGCYGTGFNGLDDGQVVIGGDDAPCPGMEGYYCDTKTGRSFGCGDDNGLSWRSCDPSKDSYCKEWDDFLAGSQGFYCYVDAGHCSTDIRSIVATVLECKREI